VLKNVFDILQWSGVNRVVNVDTSGVPLTPIPTEANGFQLLSGSEEAGV
jgi:hypothetical protein